MDDSPPVKNLWKRRFYTLAFLSVFTTLMLSFSPVRAIVALPLIVHDEAAEGDVAYVMADGPASWERLRAASDLYHWDRIKRIVVLNEQQGAGYNFILHRTAPRVERVTDYLKLYGVPSEAISTIDPAGLSKFGSLNEARSFAAQETNVESLVIVTSPPHTRRSLLSFRRSLPQNVRITSYSARGDYASDSSEIHSPLWIEYAKLVAYWFVA
ncbi:MAG: ElyC/SanA/YdcF family protein [Rubripirellula sp.]|nr:ElyC/SanA/YdcF family protein [Rubripirellula sp.]